MSQAFLEHTNLTVNDPDLTAKRLCDLFDWKIRWSGTAMDKGYTVHVGNDTSYLALYTNPSVKKVAPLSHSHLLNLNHVAVVVDDLKQAEAKAIELGLTPFSHSEYEPCNSFYLLDEDGLEVEVVSYA